MTKILALSGRKQSGKNTVSNFIIGTEMINLGLTSKFRIVEGGKLWVSDILGDFEQNEGIFDVTRNSLSMTRFLEAHLDPFVKLYSFADTLKKNVCMDVLGLSYEQCYGSDEDKNTETNIEWRNLPISPEVRPHEDEHVREKKMTAREVMQYVGTDYFRKMYPDVWVDSTLRKIQNDSPELAIICDCRFPNEVFGTQKAGGKVIRLTKNGDCDDCHESETALDENNFDWQKFDAVTDNSKLSINEQNEAIYNTLRPWGYIQKLGN